MVVYRLQTHSTFITIPRRSTERNGYKREREELTVVLSKFTQPGNSIESSPDTRCEKRGVKKNASEKSDDRWLRRYPSQNTWLPNASVPFLQVKFIDFPFLSIRHLLPISCSNYMTCRQISRSMRDSFPLFLSQDLIPNLPVLSPDIATILSCLIRLYLC